MPSELVHLIRYWRLMTLFTCIIATVAIIISVGTLVTVKNLADIEKKDIKLVRDAQLASCHVNQITAYAANLGRAVIFEGLTAAAHQNPALLRTVYRTVFYLRYYPRPDCNQAVRLGSRYRAPYSTPLTLPLVERILADERRQTNQPGT